MGSEVNQGRSRKERIEAALQIKFQPSYLEVLDLSNDHIGHSGASPSGETHYKVSLQSSAFKGLSALERHRAVYSTLNAEFLSGLHALEIETKD